MSEQACCGEGASTLIFACSGSSNVGQIANGAALALAREGRGTMSCIAAIGAHLDGFVVSAKDCERLVVIDGCHHRCAFETFAHQGLTPNVYALVTGLGLEKRHDADPTADEIDRVRSTVVGLMRAK